MKTLFAASIITLSLAAAAPAFAVSDDAGSCRNLAGKTTSALSAATTDVADARAEAVAGQQACQFGMYKNGADHYRKALSLLGK